MLDRLIRLVGRRGASLLLFAMVWFAVGLRLITEVDEDPLHTNLTEILPLWLRVAIWWIPAVVALVTICWPSGGSRNKWGFVALVLPAALRAVSFLTTAVLGFLAELIPGIRIRVEAAATCKRVVGDFRLESVKVDFKGPVSITLQPAEA